MRARRFEQFRQKLRSGSAARTETSDGLAIELMANVDLPTEAAMARSCGRRASVCTARSSSEPLAMAERAGLPDNDAVAKMVGTSHLGQRLVKLIRANPDKLG